MKTTRFLYIIMCTLLAVAFTACEKDAHDNEYPLGDGQGAFIVGLVSDQTIGNLNLFLFGNELPWSARTMPTPARSPRNTFPWRRTATPW